MITITIIVTASAYSPRRPESTVAAKRTSTRKSLNWFINKLHRGSGGAFANSLGPNLAALSPASLSSRPFAVLVWSASSTSLTSITCHCPVITISPLYYHFLSDSNVYVRGKQKITGLKQANYLDQYTN